MFAMKIATGLQCVENRLQSRDAYKWTHASHVNDFELYLLENEDCEDMAAILYFENGYGTRLHKNMNDVILQNLISL